MHNVICADALACLHLEAWSRNLQFLQMSPWSVTIATKLAHASCRNGHDGVHSGKMPYWNGWTGLTCKIVNSQNNRDNTERATVLIKKYVAGVHHCTLFIHYSIYLFISVCVFDSYFGNITGLTEYFTMSPLFPPTHLPQSSHPVLQWSVYPPPSCIHGWQSWILPPSPSPLQLLARWQLGLSSPRPLHPDWLAAGRTTLSGHRRNWIYLK